MSIWNQRVRDICAVILGGGRGTRLDPLTRLRSKPAVPIAGKFRLIDLPVSNCVHSGINRMFVLTQFNSFSLHRHISATYKFDVFSRGYVQILAAQQTPKSEQWFQGTADAVRQNLDIFTEARGDLTLVLSGDHMYRMDYREMLRMHEEHDADITLGVLPCSTEEISGFGAVRVDSSGRVVEFREKPKDAEAREGMEMSADLMQTYNLSSTRPYLASMGIYLFKKHVLAEILDNERHDFGHDVIPSALENRKIQAYFFDDYWRDIGTIRAFYDAHLDLVQPAPPFDFNDSNWRIFTNPHFPPPSRMNGVRCNHSIIADGSTIDESTIEHSVVGMRTTMRRATVRRSLLMGADPFPPDGPADAPPIGIGDGTLIQQAIIDKNARIGKNVRIVNKEGLEDASGDGWAIREGIVVVEKNAIIPDGTTI